MAWVKITGWDKGIETQRCMDVLQSFAGMTASDAKRALETVMRGELHEVPMRTDADAKLLVSALGKLGAKALIKPSA
jgi:hypothetical protein